MLYGDPKVHKTIVNNTPKFWPILSAINTLTNLLAKYLNLVLSPLTAKEFAVKNYFDFANYNHNLYKTSLDAESIYTNIPINYTYSIFSN